MMGISEQLTVLCSIKMIDTCHSTFFSKLLEYTKLTVRSNVNHRCRVIRKITFRSGLPIYIHSIQSIDMALSFLFFCVILFRDNTNKWNNTHLGFFLSPFPACWWILFISVTEVILREEIGRFRQFMGLAWTMCWGRRCMAGGCSTWLVLAEVGGRSCWTILLPYWLFSLNTSGLLGSTCGYSDPSIRAVTDHCVL